MGELLLELLSEEIPARMQRRALDDLTVLIRDKLAAAEIAPTDIRGFVTPRRLTLHAQTSFTLCCPSNSNGGWTEVRTATVHIPAASDRARARGRWRRRLLWSSDGGRRVRA